MLQTKRWIVLSAAVALSGCSSLPDIEAPLHKEVDINMSLADVQKKLGEDGELREEAKLPVSPKPRQMHPKLPPQTEYRLWTPVKNKKKQATILLGTLDGKVIFKQVIHSTGGKIKSETYTTAEYQ